MCCMVLLLLLLLLLYGVVVVVVVVVVAVAVAVAVAFVSFVLATVPPIKVRRALRLAVYLRLLQFTACFFCTPRTNRGHTGGGKHMHKLSKKNSTERKTHNKEGLPNQTSHILEIEKGKVGWLPYSR